MTATSPTTREVRATSGELIDQTITRAIDTAYLNAEPVVLVHNNTRITVTPDDTPESVHAKRDAARGITVTTVGPIREALTAAGIHADSIRDLPGCIRMLAGDRDAAWKNVERMALDLAVQQEASRGLIAQLHERDRAAQAANPTEVQWCYFYGGTHPDDAACRSITDDQVDAQETVPFLRAPAGAARRTVTYGPWVITDLTIEPHGFVQRDNPNDPSCEDCDTGTAADHPMVHPDEAAALAAFRPAPTDPDAVPDQVVAAKIVCDCAATPGDHPYETGVCEPLQTPEGLAAQQLAACAVHWKVEHDKVAADRDRWKADADDFRTDRDEAWLERDRWKDEYGQALGQAIERRDAMRGLREQRDRARDLAASLEADCAGNVADNRELTAKLTEAQGRVAWLRRTLERLVTLKDDPNGATSRAKEADAWQQARDALTWATPRASREAIDAWLAAAPGRTIEAPPQADTAESLTARTPADRTHLNEQCQALGEQLDAIKANAYRQALADAATCLNRAAGAWGQDTPSVTRTLNLHAYTEAARVLTSWANDPTRMGGPLTAAARRTTTTEPPAGAAPGTSPAKDAHHDPQTAPVGAADGTGPGEPSAPAGTHPYRTHLTVPCCSHAPDDPIHTTPMTGGPCSPSPVQGPPTTPRDVDVIAGFLADRLAWDGVDPGNTHVHATDLVGHLADHGYVITDDADGSEDPGAHALRAAADEWDRLNAGPDFTEIEALARDHYRPGMNLSTIWLRLRADAIGGGA